MKKTLIIISLYLIDGVTSYARHMVSWDEFL